MRTKERCSHDIWQKVVEQNAELREFCDLMFEEGVPISMTEMQAIVGAHLMRMSACMLAMAAHGGPLTGTQVGSMLADLFDEEQQKYIEFLERQKGEGDE